MNYRFRDNLRGFGLLLLAAAIVPAQQAAPPLPAPAGPTPSAVMPAAQTSAQSPAPQQILSVVHRMNGLEVLRFLERSGLQVNTFDYPVDQSDVHTRIAAGYALGDGGSIMTRLPQAEVDSFYQSYNWTVGSSAPVAPQTGGSGTKVDTVAPRADENSLFVLRSNGQTYFAKFLGWDDSTGLSLLQAEGLPASPAADADPARVDLEEMVRIVAPEQSTLKPLKPIPNKLVLALGEVRGHISNIVRESTGEIKSLTLAFENMTAQRARGVIGGVVLNEQGETIGMVETSDANTASVIPLAAMRRAAARVRSRQAKPGQPWLGVRGESVSATSLEQLQLSGWKRNPAKELREKQRGVLLTAVPAGTPAARSNLHAGDIVVRVNQTEIVEADDLSAIMVQADVETPLAFTVMRPDNAQEVTLTVKLDYSPDPVSATLNAEAREKIWPGQPLAAFGVHKINLTSQLATKFGAQSGWLVVEVQTGSRAYRSGLVAGDVIETVNGQPAELVISAPPPAGECRLGIVRNRQRLDVVVAVVPAKD